MSTQTNKLGLFKYDPIVDKEELFDIQEALNDNWDKIDNSIKNADWNQNDESAPDFVKNRPFYETSSVIYEASGLTQEYDNATDAYITTVDTSIPLREGSTYKIVIDGVEYTSTCVVNGVNFIIGNGHISFDYLEDTGEPFVIQRTVMPEYDMDVSTIVYKGNDFSAVTIMESTVTHIDAKYLPDTVKAQPDWNTLQNKPTAMVGGDTLTWDGNTDGRMMVDVGDGVYMVHVSNSVPTLADFANGGSCTQRYLGESGNIPFSSDTAIDAGGGCIVASTMFFCVAPEDNAEIEGIVFPEKGVYLMCVPSEGVCFTSITINGYAGFVTEKLDPAYLYQPDWNQNDESVPDFVKNKPVVFEPSDTLIWDGNTEGLLVSGEACRISSAAPTLRDLSGGCEIVTNTGDSVSVSADDLVDLDGMLVLIGLTGLTSCPEDVSDPETGDVLMPKGLYFQPQGGVYPASLTIPGYTGFGQEKIAPSHLYQPDWNQNDESAPDYVKNRFGGYYENVYSTVFEEATVDFTFYKSTNQYVAWLDGDFVLNLADSGTVVKVIFDGVEYVKTFDDSFGFEPDDTIPFGFKISVAEPIELKIYTTIEGDTHTVEISKVEKYPIPIDEKFLPDTVATKADIEAAIGAAIGGSY